MTIAERLESKKEERRQYMKARREQNPDYDKKRAREKSWKGKEEKLKQTIKELQEIADKA